MDKHPKECVNQNCKKIFFVKKSELHLPLQCSHCIEKRNERKEI